MSRPPEGPRAEAPVVRPRRLRATPALRDLFAETRIDRARLVMPHFVLPGSGRREEIASMPGIARESSDLLLRTVEADLEAGLRAVLLFGVPAGRKDDDGSGAWAADAAVPAAVRALKEAFGADLVVATDVCLCAYTSHGHCGVLSGDGAVDNDRTLPRLARMAVAHAEAGADLVAPSDMMDGRVAALRRALDAEGHSGAGIVSYAVKYASAFYGPFREAADSAPARGDRRSYQMDARNAREAVREALLDEAEGADAVLVKPGLPCLDVLRAVRDAVRVPVAAYAVSGEYAAIKLGARAGAFDERAVVVETLTALARAGADAIVTYHARDAARQDWIP